MRIQINQKGRTRHKRRYFLPGEKDVKISADVYFENGTRWGTFPVAEIEYDTLSIVTYCPHCGLQIYGAWYRNEKFIALHNDASLKYNSNYYLPEYRTKFGGLWESAEKEQKAYIEISREIEKEICDFRTMQKCPICRNVLTPKREHEGKCRPWIRRSNLSLSPEDHIDFDFRYLIYNQKDYPSVNASETIQNIKVTTLCQDAVIEKTKLANNSDLLLKYFKHILNTEMTVHLLEKRLHELYKSRQHYHEAFIRQQAEEMSEIAAAQYYSTNVVESTSGIKPTINDVVLNIAKPIAPCFTEQPPVEPVYEKPGLFNRKKVQAQNELLRSNYEADYQAYSDKKAAYDKQLMTFASEMDLYQHKKEEAFACLLNEYNRKEDERKREDEARREASRKAFIDSISRTKAELTEQLGSYVLYQATIDEIQSTEKMLSHSYACLQNLYSCGVIYEKYRNAVAISSFYDYFASERCSTLTGADGAYNIFENEVRLDRIVTKLDVVIKKLDQIIDNQYALYSAMSEMNETLKSLDRTSRGMADSLNEIARYQKNTAENTAAIAENMAVVAHNTAVTALYAKKNAELTNALGFMVALK